MDELLPWQRSQWQRLMQCKAAGRLPHALLCIGPSGLGRRVFAERLAAALLCSAPLSDGSPCGACRRCRLVRVGSHPDYSRIEPAEAGKAIRVDQIRELGTFLNHSSQFGGYKIVLLSPAERMNINAANSLLKTLEEPPKNRLLLLVTAAPARLPATVRSRCQVLVFYKPPTEEALAWLTTRVDSGTEPALLLSLANGAPLTALAYSQGGDLLRRRILFNTYRKVMAGSADPVRSAEAWLEGDLVENLSWLIGWHMDMIRLKMIDTPPGLLNPDLKPALQCLAQKLPLKILFRHLDAAIQMRTLGTTQVSPALMIEAFLGDCVDRSK